MRRVIKFDDGTIAVVYKRTDIRTKLTKKQISDFMHTREIIDVPAKKEQLWIQLPRL